MKENNEKFNIHSDSTNTRTNTMTNISNNNINNNNSNTSNNGSNNNITNNASNTSSSVANTNTNSNSNTNSILVFEYYTASGINDTMIISEAVALIESLLNDLSLFSNEEDVKIHFLVSKEFEDIGNKYNYINENKIVIDIPLEDWLYENIAGFNSCMFISAEENMNLYSLTKIIEDNNVKIYGSDSNSTLLCSNKFSTFRHLQNVVKQPRTFYFTITDESPWEVSIKNIMDFLDVGDIKESNEYKLIVKPLCGVDCQDMVILSNLEDIAIIKEKFPKNSQVIVQEFIPGENVSVSLISDGKKAIPISLNKQYTDMKKEKQEYLGGELPYNHPLAKSAFSVAKKVVESVDGIKGFVGVDLIIRDSEITKSSDFEVNQDSIYFLEINSRFTTPYVGINKIANFNIGKTIIDLLDKKIDIDSLYEKNIGSNQYENHVKFKKKVNNLDIEII
jgi:tyramine---L-glutamate ligase